jgi:hypothetical protein
MRVSQRMMVAACPLALMLGATVASAAEGEPARLRVSSALLDETVQGLLPTIVRLPPAGEPSASNRPTLATMTEIRYCGSTDKGAGRLRAVLRLESPAGEPAFLLGKSGCQDGLADVAKRIGESNEDPGIAVADVEAVWKPWDVRLSVVRAEGTTKTAKARLASLLEKRRELLTLSTGDARIQTDSGPITLYTVPTFVAGGVEIAVVLGGGGAPPSPERLVGGNRGLNITGDANAAAEIPLSFANQVLRRLTSAQAMTIPVNGDEVEVRNASLSGEGGGEGARLTLTGQATPASVRETVQWTVSTSGDPMKVAFFQLAPQLEDCGGLGTLAAVACNVRNGARAAAAQALASSLTQRYQGAFVHDLASPRTLRFSLAGERFVLTGDLLRMALGARGVSVTAKLGQP